MPGMSNTGIDGGGGSSTTTSTQRRRTDRYSPPLQGKSPPVPTTSLLTRRPISPQSEGSAADNTERGGLLEGQVKRNYILDDTGTTHAEGGEGSTTDLGTLVNGSRHSRLTILDEVVLLGLKDQQVPIQSPKP